MLSKSTAWFQDPVVVSEWRITSHGDMPLLDILIMLHKIMELIIFILY